MATTTTTTRTPRTPRPTPIVLTRRRSGWRWAVTDPQARVITQIARGGYATRWTALRGARRTLGAVRVVTLDA